MMDSDGNDDTYDHMMDSDGNQNRVMIKAVVMDNDLQ